MSMIRWSIMGLGCIQNPYRPCFFAIFTKGRKLCDFLITSLEDKEIDPLLRKSVCSLRDLLLEEQLLTAIDQGRKTENDRVACLKVNYLP